jgi:hypothetical protein
MSSFKSVLSLGALALFISAVAPACASASDASDETEGELRAKHALTACKVDSDCVAVPRVGCCDNGEKAAVNKGQVQSYAESFTCPTEHPVCPRYMIDDKRQPECNARTCIMVDIDAIACGGHAGNPHKCPAGYRCTGKGLLVDGTGSCTP